jgi:ketosteroid isomerase-like protein
MKTIKLLVISIIAMTLTSAKAQTTIVISNNENKVTFKENTDSKQEIFFFIEKWSRIWSPKEKAPNFNKEVLKQLYVQSDEFIAFDFTDATKKTVIKGAKEHHSFWEPFMRQFKYWTFTPDLQSVKIHALTKTTATLSLYVDNYGIFPDGTIFEAKAHATLVLQKKNKSWKIIHENIWGPVRE